MSKDLTRVQWWMDRMVDEATNARNAMKQGSTQVALAAIAQSVEALADVLGDLDARELEQNALDLRNELFTMSETWDESHKEESK